MKSTSSYPSWGHYPPSSPEQIVPLHWLSQIPALDGLGHAVLARGEGRSYGDSCLNNGGALLDALALDRFILFDSETGRLRCEAGVTLDAILRLIVPRGWFLPVTPGTKFVTVGGAVANDVHGKNHHRAGSFGCHVAGFELFRSDGARVLCTPDLNSDLFRATVGGLGLTGLILWVELQLKQVPGAWIDCEQIRFRRIEEFFEISADSDASHEYTVAWLDCASRGKNLGRGIFLRGNHCAAPDGDGRPPRVAAPRLAVPFNAPESLINRFSVRAFNTLHFLAPMHDRRRDVIPYEPFFYPLDRVAGWNRLYGRRGFLQYQFVVPYEQRQAVGQVLGLIEASRLTCSLSVLKVFGAIPSPGLLSFPRPGVTLALDFPMQGRRTLDLCDRFDQIVRGAGGAVYPAKDARMSGETFVSCYPNLDEFEHWRDPRFSSDFWRRVSGGLPSSAAPQGAPAGAPSGAQR